MREIDADPTRRKEYGEVLAALDAVTAEENRTRLRDAVMSAAAGGSSALSSADSIYRLSLARPKPDLERDPAYQERNWKRIREREEKVMASQPQAYFGAAIESKLADLGSGTEPGR